MSEHWALVPLGEIAQEVRDRLDPSKEPDLPYVGLADVEPGQRRIPAFGVLDDVSSLKTRFRSRDVLFAKLRPYLHKVAQADRQGAASTDLLVLRPRNGIDPDFLYWRLTSDPVVEYAERHSAGTKMPRTSWARLAEFELPLPPLPEQRKIAAILSSVDGAIGATRKVIEQTKRVKQGLLQILMTRGIGHTRFKTTAIGKMPESWEVVPLGIIATLQRGFDITVAEQNPGNVPVVSSSGINSWHDRAMVQPPGVVTGRKGALGSVYYLDVPFWPHDTSLWVKDFHGNDSRWVAWLLRSLRLERYDAATSVPTLNRNNVHPLRVRRPPVREQAEIAHRLDHLNSVLVEQEKVVAQLGRVKRGLMQDLLTGRVRVQPD